MQGKFVALQSKIRQVNDYSNLFEEEKYLKMELKKWSLIEESVAK